MITKFTSLLHFKSSQYKYSITKTKFLRLWLSVIIFILHSVRSPFYFLLNVPTRKYHLYSRVHLEYIFGEPQEVASDLPLTVRGNKCLTAKFVEREKTYNEVFSVKGREEKQLDFYTCMYVRSSVFFFWSFFFVSFPAPFINMVMGCFLL